MVHFLHPLRTRACQALARLLFLCIAVLAANHAPLLADLSRCESEAHVEETEAKEVLHAASKTRAPSPRTSSQPVEPPQAPVGRARTRVSQCEARPSGWRNRLGDRVTLPMRC